MSQPIEAAPNDDLTLKNPKFVGFLAVNAVFITGMAILLINDYKFTELRNLWIWIPYAAVWMLASSPASFWAKFPDSRESTCRSTYTPRRSIRANTGASGRSSVS